MVASANNTESITAAMTTGHIDGMEAVQESHTQRAWAEHHEPLRRFIARRLRRSHDADDVLQTLFLNFHRHFGSSEPPAAPRAWLYRSARHAIVDRYRAAAGQREESAGDLDALAAIAVAQPAVEIEEPAISIAGCVQPLLTCLPATDREALALTDLGGATQQEAAARSGVSLPGMKARVQRARRRLKAAFNACCELTFDGRGHVLSARPRAGQASACRTCSSSCTTTC
jgi:RNA polymerase sigma-70 factor, ECF subfamily